MPRLRLVILPAVLLVACLAVLPACKKNKPSSDSGSGDSTPGPTPSAVGSSEYVLFAHLNAKAIRDSAVFAEVKEAFAKAGGMAEWDQVERDVAGKIGGIKPTDVDSVTVCVTEVPPRDVPKFVLILTANKVIDKASVFGLGPQAKPDARGFYTSRGAPGSFHFPDDKSLVMLHPDLAQRYLDGYAKNRTGWPMNADTTRAAAGHTLYAVLHLDKVPRDLINGPEAKEFAPLLAARKVTLTADLKGKELSVAARAAFADASAAGRARESVQKAIGLAVSAVEMVMSGKGPPELAGFTPAVKEAHRALKEAKVEVSGSDLVIAGSYKADFDIGSMVVEAVKKIQGSATRMTAQNNLKQIGLALHNYASSYNRVPILGVGANGAILRNATDKPLLSWRVAMLPYVEQENLYKQFRLNEPWDSEHNKKLIPLMPKIYAPTNPGNAGYTHLQMVVGPNAMQPPSAAFPGSFPDGMSNTIAVVEAADLVIWTKPDDVMLPGNTMPKDFKKKFGGQFPNGFNVLLWDGFVKFVPDTVSERTLSLLLNPRDGQVIPNDW